MAKSDKCPICGVAVKPENLIRHLDSNHPRHPDAPRIRDELKAEPGRVAPRASRPFRLRKIHVAVIAIIAILGVGAYYVAPYFAPSQTFPVTGCINGMVEAYHIHQQLSIFIQGSRYPIPTDTGNTPSCTHPIHTHADYNPATEPATLHVESPVVQTYRLGDFFTVWGQPFSTSQVLTCVASSTVQVTMTVNGASSTAFGSLPLQDGQIIVIQCGS